MFRHEPLHGDGAAVGIAIDVDGVPLRELARVVEEPHAADDGTPALAGGYAPLLLDDADLAVHYTGRPAASWFGDGDTVLLGCVCGDWGCWPLTASVDADDRHVVWHRFRNGHRAWDLGRLGPFRFARSQYDEALRRLGVSPQQGRPGG